MEINEARIIHSPTTQIGFNPEGFGSYIHVNVFKYEYKHPVMAPTLLRKGGKTYLMPEWKEVHPETTLNDIIWKKPKIKKQMYLNPKHGNSIHQVVIQFIL
jgi:hypothetical protein